LERYLIQVPDLSSNHNNLFNLSPHDVLFMESAAVIEHCILVFVFQ